MSRYFNYNVQLSLKYILFFLFQAGTGDEFLDELLSNDASLDDGAVPDIKVIDSSINMTGNEVRTRPLLISSANIFDRY